METTQEQEINRLKEIVREQDSKIKDLEIRMEYLQGHLESETQKKEKDKST